MNYTLKRNHNPKSFEALSLFLGFEILPNTVNVVTNDLPKLNEFLDSHEIYIEVVPFILQDVLVFRGAAQILCDMDVGNPDLCAKIKAFFPLYTTAKHSRQEAEIEAYNMAFSWLEQKLNKNL